MVTFKELHIELQATIFSYFTSYEAYHVLQWVCKDWFNICRCTNFREVFFVTAHYKVICLNFNGQEEYTIDWKKNKDKDNSWLTGITMTPDYDFLVCDYDINGLHRFKFNLNTWKYEYHSLFWEFEDFEETCPEAIIFDNRKLYIAADENPILSCINENKELSIIFESETEPGIWGMTKVAKEDKTEFLCCFTDTIKRFTIFPDGTNKYEDFIVPPDSIEIKRLGSIESHNGLYYVLDSFNGNLFLFSENEFISILDSGEHLNRAFDLAFIDRELYPYIPNDKSKKQEKSSTPNTNDGVSLLVFTSNGIIEYTEEGEKIRDIQTLENTLQDCNFACKSGSTLITI